MEMENEHTESFCAEDSEDYVEMENEHTESFCIEDVSSYDQSQINSTNIHTHTHQEILFQNCKILTGLISRETITRSDSSDSESDKSIENNSNPQPSISLETTNWFNPSTSIDVDNLGTHVQSNHEVDHTQLRKYLKNLDESFILKPRENCVVNDPEGLTVKLKPHQKYALAWLLWREQQIPSGGILADDMDLGKTVTMISFILTIRRTTDESGNSETYDNSGKTVHQIKQLKHKGETLIVCPASLIQHWNFELKTCCENRLLHVLVFHGNNRKRNPRILSESNVVITSYETLVIEWKKKSDIYQIQWKCVILDEAHMIRNSKSLKCEAVCNLVAKSRWALTGTPIQNKEDDLYSIVKFLQCSPFDDIGIWRRCIGNNSKTGREQLTIILKTIMLQRTRKQLQNLGEIDLIPEKIIHTVSVELNSDERAVYQTLFFYSKTLFVRFLVQQTQKKHMIELLSEGDIKSYEMLVFLLRLRKICCHPSLIKAMLDKDHIETTDGLIARDSIDFDLISKLENLSLEDKDFDCDKIIGADKAVMNNPLTSKNPLFNKNTISSKLKVALSIIIDVIEKEEKIVVVSQWISFLELLSTQLDNMIDFKYEYFTEKINANKKQDIIENFNTRGKNPKILLITLNTGSMGLNLTGANHMLILDIHWNPQLELQAHNRVHRLGQDKQVYIHRLLCKDTIEERIQDIQNQKLEIASNILQGKNILSKFTIDDLKILFSG